MKKRIIFPIVLVQCFLTVSGQVTFDKGYVINNSGIKIECLIKNYDWRANPRTIQYKLSEESPIVSASIDSIQEFGINNYAKYVRTTVRIDRSPIELEKLSTTREPLWSEETLFLRELTCGKACLWVYTEYGSWFFYSLNGSPPEQLVYKRYTFNRKEVSKDVIYENAGFRQQLSIYLQNEKTKDVNLENLKYREEPLVKYVKRYNSAFEENVQPNIKKTEREILNLKLTASLNYSRLNIENKKLMSYGKCDFGSKINWMGGLESEYFLPFNRNTISLLFSPTFEHYKTEKIIQNSPQSIDMISIHFPVGGRYSLYLNNDMRFFFDAYYNSFIGIYKNDGFVSPTHVVLDIKERDSFILGGGFAHKRWQFELKYHTSRTLLDHVMWSSDYTKVSLTVSYKLLSVKK